MSNPSDIISPADIIAASGHVAYSWDLVTDRIIWCGPWQNLFGFDRQEPPGHAAEMAQAILSNDHHLVFNDTLPAFDREYRFRQSDGSLVYVHEHGTTDFEKGRPIRQQGLIRKIEAPSVLDHQAYVSPDRDTLTGRPNRACMLSIIEKVIGGAPDIKKQSAYMIVGIDKLAFVNEAMGTKAADQLICDVADRLNGLCPSRAIVGRVSGDTFGILMPAMGREIIPLAERIIQHFHDHAVNAGMSSLHISVGIGSVLFSEVETNALGIMVHAEQALHDSRERGPGQHIAYVKSDSRAEQNRAILEIGERIKEALKNNTLRLAFQPVFDAKTGDIQFYEVLSRLFRQDGSLIPAGDFIPVVEKLGLAPDFDRHVLDLAIEELEAGENIRLAVNISGLTAALPDWPEFVHSRLASRPHVAKRLIIEITENAAVLDIAKIKCLVDSLRSMGSQVALDDFGAGSTSIRHLRDLSLAIMKIDRDLLNNILTSPEQQHLVRMLVSMAHGLGLRTVAEGIETEDVADWLRLEGVDMLQGFYLGRPSLDRPWRLAAKEKAEPVSTFIAIDGTLVPTPAAASNNPSFFAY